MSESGVTRRVVVTGMGVVTPIGTTVPDFWAACQRGQSGVGPLDGFPARGPEDPDRGADQGFRPQGPPQALPARQDHPARRPLLLVRRRCGRRGRQPGRRRSMPFDDPYRAACIIGSGAGGLVTFEKAYRDLFIDNKRATHPADAAAHHRLLGRRARRHRVRHQGPDIRHLQRLLHGRARHRRSAATTSATAWSTWPSSAPPRASSPTAP